MSEDDFLAVLKSRKTDSRPLPGLDVLKEFCSAIKKFVGGPVDCEAVPSDMTVAYGQAYKVVITYYPASYSNVLLRAYLNDRGQPYLDLYDAKGPQPCGDVPGLGSRLKVFLSTPGVSDMLERFRHDSESRR